MRQKGFPYHVEEGADRTNHFEQYSIMRLSTIFKKIGLYDPSHRRSSMAMIIFTCAQRD